MPEVLFGLGSNVGEPQRNLAEAVSRLGSICLVKQVSSLYRTEPVGYRDQDWFLNCAVLAETSLNAPELLDRVLRLETSMGRERTVKNGPRTIDVDILLYGDRKIDEPPLLVPHPRMHQRAFVLEPAAEIAPAMRHPTLETTVLELRNQLSAAESVEMLISDAWPPLREP